jgi:hypothetical protein
MADRRSARALAVLWGVLALAACDTSPTAEGPEYGYEAPDLPVILAGLSMDAAAARITTADMATHIGVLADDSMKGRQTGRPELERAAAYIADRLAAAGVEPAGTEGYLYRWPLPLEHRTGWQDSLATRPPNVVGVIRGSSPQLADTWVVVTAHFDHLGVLEPYVDTDSIYNGADDNASGTAALLEVADALASLPTPPRRSILFLAVSGEELGLLGSGAYVADPTVALDGVVADINLDMISRGGSGDVLVIGYDLSTLTTLVDAAADQLPGLGLAVHNAESVDGLMRRSDHFHFARNGIPAIGFFTGLHHDYHRPSDEPDRADPTKAARVARLAAYVVAGAAMITNRPEWTEAGRRTLEQYW